MRASSIAVPPSRFSAGRDPPLLAGKMQPMVRASGPDSPAFSRRQEQTSSIASPGWVVGIA
jgi:hypothetical protein